MIFNIAVEKLSDITLLCMFCREETAIKDEGLVTLDLVVVTELRNRKLLNADFQLNETGHEIYVNFLNEDGPVHIAEPPNV